MKKLLFCAAALTASAMHATEYRLRGHATVTEAGLSQSGDLDTSFHNTGIICAQFGNFTESIGTSLGLEPDNKIVIGGYGGFWGSKLVTAVGRYNQDGTLDTKFGHNGFAETQVGNNDTKCAALAIQSDGNIVVVGWTGIDTENNTAFALMRYTTNGILDKTFGKNGTILTRIGYSSQASSVTIQPDGKIVVSGIATGTARNDTSYCFVVARYNPNGSLDDAFGTHGITTTYIVHPDDSTYSYAAGIAVRSNGKIVVGGYSNNLIIGQENQNGIVIAQYTEDGNLDTTFNYTGISKITLSTTDLKVTSIALTSDNKILVSGKASGEGDYSSEVFLARFTVNGSLDNTFGHQGMVITPVDLVTNSTSMQLQSNGDIILAGKTQSNDQPNKLLLMRYHNGVLDTTFGHQGIVRTQIESAAEAMKVIIQPDGRIVVVGRTILANNDAYNFILARYLP